VKRVPLRARKPLGRHTGLAPGKALERRVLQAGSAPGGRHRGKGTRAPRDTGPDRKTRALVLARDGHSCVCCGLSVIGQRYDLQHRDARGMGGTSDPRANSPVNLLVMLREHHQRVESRRDPHDNGKGYWLRMGEDPALTPVMYFERSGSGVLMYLDDLGGISPDAPAGCEVA
jgi:hypothetical protein